MQAGADQNDQKTLSKNVITAFAVKIKITIGRITKNICQRGMVISPLTERTPKYTPQKIGTKDKNKDV